MAENTHPTTYEQLVAYAVGDLSPSQAAVLRRHLATCPECRATARRLYQLRTLLRRPAASTHRPPPATTARAKAIFRQHRAAVRQSAWPERVLRALLQPRLRYALSLIILIITCGVSTTYAMADISRDALPGEPLYPVKTALEDLRLAVVLDETQQARLRVRFAQIRAQEIADLAEEGRYSALPDAALAFEADVVETTQLLETVMAQDPQLGVSLARRIDSAVARTSDLLDQLQTTGAITIQPNFAPVQATSAANVAVAVARIPAVTMLPIMASPTGTSTRVPSATFTASPTSTPRPPMPTPTLEPTVTAWPTKTPVSTPTNTALPTPTSEPPTPTPTDTPEPTATETPLPTDTPEPTPTPTDTPEPTATETPLPTHTPEPTSTPTGTLEPIAPPTSTPWFGGKPTRTPRPTQSP